MQIKGWSINPAKHIQQEYSKRYKKKEMAEINSNDIYKHIHTLGVTFNEIKDSLPNTERQDIGDLLERSRIGINETIPIPPICLEVVGPTESSTLGTLGNFSAVIGKAKSKKTFLITMVLATAIRNDLILDKFKATFPEDNSKVLFFDTEQSKYHVQKVVKRVCHLAHVTEPKNFECFGLRSLSTQERIEAIEYALNTIPGIGLVVIDGVRDLVKNINCPEESTDIVGRLMRWSEEKNIHVIVVLHQNKGDNNARGHLGTEVINKAESTISVTRDVQDSSISIVEAEYCRDKDFRPFAFKIDERGIPYVLNDWQPPKEGKRTQSPFDYPKEAHIKILKEVFRRSPKPKYQELWQEVKYVFQQYGITGGNNKAKEWVKYYENQNMVLKSVGEERYPTYTLSI